MNAPAPPPSAAALEQSRASFFEGVAHFEAGRLAQARSCFERCLTLTPGRPSVLSNLGITLCRLGHLDEAVPLLTQATAADPSITDAWAALGLAHESQGRWAAAVPALEQALQRAPALQRLWRALGHGLLRMGHHAQALDALDRALSLDAADASAWTLRGHLLRETGRHDDAAQSFERALAQGGDAELLAYYLAAVRHDGAPPPRAPRGYVQSLFDDYAGDFQSHLVEQLGYRGHEVLLEPVVHSGRRFDVALDLGCGTGLCGSVLAPQCNAIDGVDLSAAMLGQARRTSVYRELVQADLLEFLAAPGRRAELVVAADVLIYVGALEPVLQAVAHVLAPDGIFAFTVELPSNGQALQLLPSLRYAHSQASVRTLAAAHGMAVQTLREAPIRHEQGRPVPGLYVTLRRLPG